MKKKDRDFIMFLEDILDSANLIEKYVKGKTKKIFAVDGQTKDAVIRRFEIIGEATKHVPNSLKKNHKEIEWNRIADMRNVLIHEYFGVNVDKVWVAIKEDVPNLKEKISKILEDLKVDKLI